jgi:hypothetical protein
MALLNSSIKSVPLHIMYSFFCIKPEVELFQLLQNSLQIHHRIKPNSKKVIEKSSLLPKNTISKREGELFLLLLPANRPKVSVGIKKKNEILSDYELSCKFKGITSQVFASTNKGENQPLQSYSSNSNLIKECTMKPSLNHQY